MLIKPNPFALVGVLFALSLGAACAEDSEPQGTPDAAASDISVDVAQGVPAIVINEVASIKELLRMQSTQRHLSHIRLSACWMSLGRLVRQTLDE